MVSKGLDFLSIFRVTTWNKMSWSPSSVNIVLQKSTVGSQKPPEFPQSLGLRIFSTWKCCQKCRWYRRVEYDVHWVTPLVLVCTGLRRFSGCTNVSIQPRRVPGKWGPAGHPLHTLLLSNPSVCVTCRVVSASVGSPGPSQP